MDLGTANQKPSYYFGLVGGTERNIYKYTPIQMILYVAFSKMLLLLIFFNGFPGEEDFLKFALALLTVIE